MIEFFVPCNPVGKARARVTRNGTFTPKKTVDAERMIELTARTLRGFAPLIEGPIRLTIAAKFEYPKSWSTKRRYATFWHTSKPDDDNVAKLVRDALNKVLWHDDSQVADSRTSKFYTHGQPGLEIRIEEISHAAP